MNDFFTTSLHTTPRLVEHMIVYYASQAKKLPMVHTTNGFLRAKTQHIVDLRCACALSGYQALFFPPAKKAWGQD